MTSPEAGTSLLDLALPLVRSWKLLAFGSVAAGLLAVGITSVIAPTFTARTSFLPPQQQQSAAAAALASLGALTSFTGAGTRTPADQYVALLQSAAVEDRLIDAFKLMDVYESKFRVDARRSLEQNVRVTMGKKDGLISIEVDDHDPIRAAAIANQHVVELRWLTTRLALTEAQQRRSFFQGQLQETRDRLTQAQVALQASGFDAGALRAEPRAAADNYARLRAELTATEVRLQTLRRSLTDNSNEVQQQLSAISALREQLSRVEASAGPSAQGGGADYISKYREFKYQETLFDLFSRQYELARLDESREGAFIQVVDAATPPEKKSKPRRAFTVVVSTVAAASLLALYVLLRYFWRQSMRNATTMEKMSRLRAAMRRQ